MLKIRLYDTNFSHHAPGSSISSFPGFDVFPKHIEWVRDPFVKTKYAFFTENCLDQVDSCDAEIKYAWILEPRDLISGVFGKISDPLFYNKFDKIFTHDGELLSLNPDKFHQYVFGGCWISPEDQRIHEKTDNVCIISSYKNQLPGHLLRHQIINELSNKYNIAVYGNGYSPFEKTIDVLKKYRYCIVVENVKRDFWVTEKLIQCFRVGTIPIYYGSEFNSKIMFTNNYGFFRFETIEQLDQLLPMMNEEFYNFNLVDGNINTNFEISKRYTVCEDLIYENLTNLIGKK